MDGYPLLAVPGQFFSARVRDPIIFSAAPLFRDPPLGLDMALLDGEVTVVRPDGTTSFPDLQRTLSGDPPPGSVLCYYLFDAIHLDGEDLASLPLIERKHRLELVLAGQPSGSPLRYGDHVEGNGPTFYAHACKHGLEGIISKRRNAPYRQGRTRDWLKVKYAR